MRHAPLAAAIIYAAAYFAFLYQPGLIRMDDFGYLQGVVESISAGRPHTNAWLCPYAATLSGMCALAYGLTGNFILSTWGLQSLFVLAGAGLLYRLFRGRMSPAASAGLALVVATQPCYWHKCSEFAATVSTMVFAIGALLAYRRRLWIWFFPLVFLAFANRQNNLALLALPVFHLVFDRGLRRHERAWIAAGLMVFACAAFLLHASLNRTIAQSFGIYAGMDAAKALAVFRTQVFGAAAALGFLSLFGILGGESPIDRIRANLGKPALPLLASVAFWLLPVVWSLPMLSFLTPLIGSLDRAFALQWILLLAVPFLLWSLDWSLIRFDAPLCLVLAYISISSLMGFWYDFYLIDVALASFFLRLTREAPMRPGRLAVALGSVFLTAHLAWAYGYRIVSDKQRISIAAFESLERAGRASPPAMTDGTFGYLGWKLFDHYWRHERITDLAAYQGYVRRNRIVLETELPWRRSFKRADREGEEVLTEGIASIGFFRLRYRMRDLHDTAAPALCDPALRLDTAAYVPRPYPLDNGEWSEYIAHFPRPEKRP
ncbi:MAG: hypothetical protein JWP91_3766 [Fibrobacteres bacterium]|nr:hypothetical protein [Fibrobacterota bacterium]